MKKISIKHSKILLITPLTVALISLLFSRHSVLLPWVESSIMRVGGIAIILAVWFAVVLVSLRTEKSLLLSAIIALLFFVSFVFNDLRGFSNYLNSVFVVFSFPIAIALGKRMGRENICNSIIITTIAIVAVSALFSSELFVSYLGDARENRLTLGFLRPTFLAEAALIVLFAAALKRNKLHILFVLAVILILLSGSRAAVGTVFVFTLYVFYRSLNVDIRITFLFISAFVATFLFVFLEPNVSEINLVTSGRLYIWVHELFANLLGTQWIFGNYNAQESFIYSSDRYGLVYHLDSFFVEHLIINGLLGLVFIFVLIILFLRSIPPGVGRGIVYSLLFYGCFENSVFNITSAFAFFPLVLAVSSANSVGSS